MSRMWAYSKASSVTSSKASSVTSSTHSSRKPRPPTASSHSVRSDGDYTESQTDASSMVSEETTVGGTRSASSRSRGSLFGRCARPKVRL